MSESTEVGSVFVSNYPPYSFWTGEDLSAVNAALDAPPRPDTPLGLYLHIPFCRRRCHFCYFRVYTDKDGKQIATYLDAMAREIELLAERAAVRGRTIDFVYFGGGTPSYISVDHLRALVDRITTVMPWNQAREITFECEPGTLSQPKLQAIRDIGVTRLSLGIENWNDEVLSHNGRAHLSAEIDRVRPWIQDLEFDQVNVDLIAGMIGETWDSWRETVQRTIDYGPDSVTIYQLELPYNTTFTKELQTGHELPVADWETKRAWHDWAFEQFAAAGFAVSSAYTMVRKDKGSSFLYRDALFHGADLLGTGVASFSHLSGVHFQNADGWGDYLGAIEQGQLPTRRAFPTSAAERLTRELILQLKLGTVSTHGLSEKFGVDVIEAYRPALDRLAKSEMLVVEDDALRLTRKGLLQVDLLLPEFYDPKYQNARYT